MRTGFGGVLWDSIGYARRDRKGALAILLVVMAAVSFLLGIFGQFVFLVLMGLCLFVAFLVGEFGLKKVGIELVTLVTVLSGIAFGPITGLILGAVMLMLHFVLARSMGPYIIYCIPMMAVIGFLAGSDALLAAAGGNMVMLGIALSLVYNIVTAGIGMTLSGNIFDDLLWSGTNLAMNWLLFSTVAPLILAAI